MSPTPLGALERTPLGAFYRTPLGAFGPGAAAATDLWACTIQSAQTGTATDIIAALASSAESGQACGQQYVGLAMTGVGPNTIGELIIAPGAQINASVPWNQVFDTQPANVWRGWTVRGDTSGVRYPLSDLALSFSCSQRQSGGDVNSADVWWGPGRVGAGRAEFPNGAPDVSQGNVIVPGQNSGILTYWNLLPSSALPYPFIQGESGVIEGPPL